MMHSWRLILRTVATSATERIVAVSVSQDCETSIRFEEMNIDRDAMIVHL